MNRRAFLALIRSAPLAALAPWPKILEQHTIGISRRFIRYYDGGFATMHTWHAPPRLPGLTEQFTFDTRTFRQT